tara:strand:- start:146 stop:1555 length:1410 start_codon:yes stop_codon:yes gene_type:complete
MSFEFMGDRYEYIDYGDSTTNNIKNLNVLFGKVMTETLMPGSLDRLFDYTKTFGKDQTRYDQNIYETDQFVKFVTGWGMSPMNKEYLENIHGFKTTDYSKMKSQHRNNISNGIGDVLEYDKFINNYVDMNMLHYKNFTKYTKFNESAELLGLNTAKLMKDNGVSKADMGYVRQAKFKPLGVTDDMQLKMLEKDDNKVRIEIMRDIHRIDRILSSMPVLYDDNHYKIYKEDKEFIDLRIEDVKRKPKVTGGLITGPKVPNAKENSSDRVDPFTGAPYSDQMARLGLVKGGLTEDKLLNFILATEDVNLYQDYRKGNLDKIVKAHEGSKRFQEAHGKKDVPTIGGITGSGITQATVGQTVGMVRNRINEERNYLNKILPEEIRKTIPKNVQDSAVSLIFNVGQGAFKKSKAYQNLAQGNIEGFYKEAFDPNIGFTKITGADGTPRVDEGLVNRRRQELEFAQGLWQDPYKQ